jgi:uncharacterized protein YkvS
MKLNVDQKLVGSIPNVFIENLLNAIDENDWFVDDYRATAGNMENCNSIPILHSHLCINDLYSFNAIKDIAQRPLFSKYFLFIEDILNELKKYYSFRQYACFLSRLRPNGVIGFHRDNGYFLELCHRVHIPLKSNPNVEYVIENNSYYWEPGNIYEFDNTRLHGVFNNSNENRIHLVVNLYNFQDEELHTETLSEKHKKLLVRNI